MLAAVQSCMYNKDIGKKMNKKLINQVVRRRDQNSNDVMQLRALAQPRSQEKKLKYIKIVKGLLGSLNL